MIRVKRIRDGKVFDSDMSGKLSILEMHFCTSYTQVIVQDLETGEKQPDIVLKPDGTNPSWVDLIAIQDCDEGVLL